MHASDSTALRLGPGNWRTPVVPPLVIVIFVLVALASMIHSLWSLLEPAFLADPRAEVRGFVNAVRSGAATEGDRAALAAYRGKLPPRAQEALAHEINYLLFRDGRVQRFGFDSSGRLIDLLPELPSGPDRFVLPRPALPGTPAPEPALAADPLLLVPAGPSDPTPVIEVKPARKEAAPAKDAAAKCPPKKRS